MVMTNAVMRILPGWLTILVLAVAAGELGAQAAGPWASGEYGTTALDFQVTADGGQPRFVTVAFGQGRSSSVSTSALGVR